jgi:hypothetical protein
MSLRANSVSRTREADGRVLQERHRGKLPEMKCKLKLIPAFVSPCNIIYSNKSTNQMHQSLSFIACHLNTAQHVSGILMPIISSLSTAVAASGLPMVIRDTVL